VVVAVVAVLIVLVPGAVLISILVLSRVLNVVLLLPLLAFMCGISRDRDLMGEFTAIRGAAAAYGAAAMYLVTIAFIAWCSRARPGGEFG
jgi:Mn2+/Fe2+ NRAMP family transporter